MKYLIDQQKIQYKANLHCHTTFSDGHWTPQQVKAEYKKRGYSVVAITDHEYLVDHSNLNDSEILFITAYEMYVRKVPYDKIHDTQAHINLYSKTPTNKMVYYTPELTKNIPQEELMKLDYYKFVEKREHTVDFIRQTIEDARECGYLVCHNHPTWSFEDESCAAAYDNCFAMEIYNHTCYQMGYCEYNQHYYDYQTNRGLTMGVIAADDNHNRVGESDAFGGVTYILAEALTYESILQALENREFYASTGPKIYSLSSENGELSIQSSAVERIIFVTDTRHRKAYIAPEGELITQARFTISSADKWVRVEVVDGKGCRAFTRAFQREELFE